MATGLEVFGALTALSTAAGQLMDLSGWFRRCNKTLSHAKEDIQEVADETTIFTTILEMFHDTMQTMLKKDSPSARDSKKVKLVCRISCRSETILIKIQNLLVKVDPLRTDKNHSRILRTIAKWKWLMDKDDVEPLLRALNSVKLNLILFTKLLDMDTINEEIATLKAANKEISIDLKRRANRYRKHVKQLKKQCEEADWRCQQLQARSIQRWELEDHSEDDITSLLISIVDRELEEHRSQHAQHSSEVSSDAPLDSTGGQGEVIVVEERGSDRNQTNSDMSVVRLRDASIDVSVAPQTHEIRHTSDDIDNQTDLPPSTEPAQPPTGNWVPMPGWGDPRPQERPRAPRASQEDLPIGNVIYDDGTEIREEYRRPRTSRQRRSQERNHHSGPSSALGGSSGGENLDTGSGSSGGAMGGQDKTRQA